MTTVKTKLKPCPFCGAPAKVIPYVDDTLYWITCAGDWDKCPSGNVTSKHCNTIEEAAKNWNIRKRRKKKNDKS